MTKTLELTDQQYFGLSQTIYKDEVLNIGKAIDLPDGSQWVVIDYADTSNGYQGMAVVPKDDYEAYKAGEIREYDNVVIASRGTEAVGFDGDVGEDIDQIATGGKIEGASINPTGLWKEDKKLVEADNQFIDAQKFHEDVMEKYSPENVYVTGHSLGGALSQYLVVKNDNTSGVTYAAPNIYRSLSREDMRRVRSGEFNDRMIDYAHDGEPIGLYEQLKGTPIGREVITKTGKKRIDLLTHFTSTYSSYFNKDGSVMMQVDAADVERIVNNMREIYIDELDGAMQKLREVKDYEEYQISEIKRKWKGRAGLDEYRYVEDYDVDDMIESLAPYKRTGEISYYSHTMDESNYFFHDDYMLGELYTDLENEKNYILEFLDRIVIAARKFEENDLEGAKTIEEFLN